MGIARSKSPFPAMDPYLEEFWHDIHVNLVASAGTALNDLLPDDLVARSEDRVVVGGGDADGELFCRPGVTVGTSAYSMADLNDGLRPNAPIELVIEPETDIQHFIRITNAHDETLIAVIEFLSPSNKLGAGMQEYRRKRDDLLAQGVHVVEIDLVRRGDWRALLMPGKLKVATPYRVVSRIGASSRAFVYPIVYDEALPSIQIPLRPGDPEVLLALQPLLDEAYRGGRYGTMLRYDRPLYPAPLADEAAVIQSILRAAGKDTAAN